MLKKQQIKISTVISRSRLDNATWAKAIVVFRDPAAAVFAASKELGVTYKTAWNMARVIRIAAVQGEVSTDPIEIGRRLSVMPHRSQKSLRTGDGHASVSMQNRGWARAWAVSQGLLSAVPGGSAMDDSG